MSGTPTDARVDVAHERKDKSADRVCRPQRDVLKRQALALCRRDSGEHPVAVPTQDKAEVMGPDVLANQLSDAKEGTAS
jgi:hypothetical protein